MTKYTWEDRSINGIKHEKQDEIKEHNMLPSGIFKHETKHHHCDDFVSGVKETSSQINEGFILHSHVYEGKDAHCDVQAGYGNIEFKSQTRVEQLSGGKRIQYIHHVCYWD